MYKVNHKEILKIDLGAEPPLKGFVSCPLKLPLPFPSDSVTLISASHVFEKVSRENMGFFKLMDELWRILKVDGQMRLATYYGGSTPFMADPSHVNPLTIQSWNFFDPEAMGGNLYNKYKPKPWKIESVYVQTECTMEVLLSKRKL